MGGDDSSHCFTWLAVVHNRADIQVALQVGWKRTYEIDGDLFERSKLAQRCPGNSLRSRRSVFLVEGAGGDEEGDIAGEAIPTKSLLV